MEEAVRLRERDKSLIESITVVSIGPPKAQDVLRTALAMGADSAIHIEHKDGETVEPLAVAKALRAVVEQEKPDLVIMGKQAIDDDASQVGGMLGGLLSWPQANFASSVELKDGGKGVEVAREIDGGLETLKMTLPAIVTTDLRLNEPRYASLPNIMKVSTSPIRLGGAGPRRAPERRSARWTGSTSGLGLGLNPVLTRIVYVSQAKKKPIKKVKPEDLGLDFSKRLETVNVSAPPPRKGGKKVSGRTLSLPLCPCLPTER